MIYNMMTCNNMGKDILGNCSLAWLGLVILFFVAAFTNKWLGKEMEVPFNFIASLVIGILAYVVVMTFSGSARWSILAGLIGEGIGGFLGGITFGGASDDGGGGGDW